MDDKLSSSRDTLIQALGRQSAFWGLGKTAGEMYAALYLSPEPLSLEEVAQRLKVTKGNISVAIRQLEQLNMVKRSRKIGDRRVFFEAEGNFWKVAHSVLGMRHKPEFEETFALLDESIILAEQAAASPEKSLVIERLKSLQEFYGSLDSLVEVALSMEPGHLSEMAKMIKLFTANANVNKKPTF